MSPRKRRTTCPEILFHLRRYSGWQRFPLDLPENIHVDPSLLDPSAARVPRRKGLTLLANADFLDVPTRLPLNFSTQTITI
jgi:hypothetical protein